MNCELAPECGFHKLLIQIEKIKAGEDCPKEPVACSRYRIANQEVDVSLAEGILRTEGALGDEVTLTAEEIQIAYGRQR